MLIRLADIVLILRSINRMFILERETLQSIDFAAFSRARGVSSKNGVFDAVFTKCS